MVSRQTCPTGVRPSPGSRLLPLLTAWRRLLGRVLLAAARARRGVAPAARSAAAAAAGAERDGRGGGMRALGAAGAVAAGAGTAAGLALGTLGDGTVTGAALFSVETCAWAAFRLIVVALTGPHELRAEPRTALAVWGAGLAPYTLGLTPALRASAFAASAFLTYRLLAGSSGDRPGSGRAVAWAFGGQTAAAATGWLVANGLVFLPLMLR